jgi:NADPH:quinone reductase-like Zn-dependent oxidoreductase
LGGEFQGVLADYVVMPEDWLVRAPASLDAGEAATLPCAGVTAWSALVETGKLKAGETVLVHGTGGVALFGLAIARAMGASVYVVTSSDDKAARVKALGAAGVLRRDSGDWVPEFYRLTGDHGADHVVETVGGANLGRSVSAAAPGGRVALIGVIDGFEVTAPTGPLMLKWVTVQGIGVGPRSSLEALAAAVESVGIKPVIDRRYRLEELPAALDHLARGPFGKLVIEL